MWRECTCVLVLITICSLLLCLALAACSEVVLFGSSSSCALIVQECIFEDLLSRSLTRVYMMLLCVMLC